MTQSPNNRNFHHVRTGRITISALLSVVALMFTYVEVLLPYNIGIPGVKLGLANLVIMLALYRINFRYAFVINIVRVILATLLFAGVFAMIYSLAGATISLIIMTLLHKTNKFSMIGVSMAGGVAHNFGQLLVASLVVSNLRMFTYFPVLVFSGIVSGIGIGIIAYIIDKKVPPHIWRTT